MRSEQEIRNRITKLQELEDREAKDIQEMIENDETDFLDLTMDRANMYQAEKHHLMWVLGEIN